MTRVYSAHTHKATVVHKHTTHIITNTSSLPPKVSVCACTRFLFRYNSQLLCECMHNYLRTYVSIMVVLLL